MQFENDYVHLKASAEEARTPAHPNKLAMNY